MSENPVSERVYKAVRFATSAHGRQARKGTGIPYIVHPINVARLLSTVGCEKDVVIAGMLHDIIEDTDRTEDNIRKRFGGRVANILVGASEPNHGKVKWEVRKQHTIDFIMTECTDKDILVVIAADKLDNLMAIRQDLDWADDKDAFWVRFSRGKAQQQQYFESLAQAFSRHEGRSEALKLLLAQFRSVVSAVFP